MSTTKTLRELLIDIEYYCSRKQTRNAYRAVKRYIEELLKQVSTIDRNDTRLITIDTYLKIMLESLNRYNYKGEICKYYRAGNHTCTAQKGAPGTHCSGDINNCEEVN